MKKVFLTEPIHQDGVDLLSSEAEVILGSNTDPETIIKEAVECEGILIRSAKITGEIIKNLPNLKVIGKHGIGVDNIDVQTATEQGVFVVNAPESNINAVAEHAFAMIMGVAKNFIKLDSAVRENQFHLRNKYICTELKGKTVGLIGLGKIGLLLVKKLQALDVKIIGFDPYVDPKVAEAFNIQLVSDVNTIYSEGDFISIHVPLTNETRGLIGEKELNLMKESAFLINVSRGSIVDESALFKALKDKRIKGAALDVFESEPPPADHPLFGLDNILLSPHNAALTDEALVAMATQSAQGILDHLSGKKPKYLVNKEVL